MSTIDGFRLDGNVSVVAGAGGAGGAIRASAVAKAVNDALALVGAQLNEGPFTPACIAAAFQELGKIDLARCAEVAAKRFGPARMADGYLNVYERAIEQARYDEPPLS